METTMEDNNQLNYSWLGGLSNANHDGTTQQIDDTAARSALPLA